MNDTIVAISTALGVGAISIIRLSGNDSIEIVNKIFKGKDLRLVESHTINYGYIIENEKIIDEVLVSVMKGPKSFTTEDIVEINCHGGIATTNKILELTIQNGARMAEPGEFTKRAFLNGRIDLKEAEAVEDLINAKSQKARSLAINQLTGKTSNLIRNLRQEILTILASIEVNIDYPEYEDIEVMTIEKVRDFSEKLNKSIDELLKDSENGKLIKEGINTVIIGRPNVGKSSILNCLLNEDKAIVTDIPGTTRDVVEGSIRLNGILVNFLDTAGIRETDNKVEKIGVDKSLSLIDQADLILLVLNNNEKFTKEDEELLEKTKNKKRIIVINKMDLDTKIDKEFEDAVRISANEDVEPLLKKINELFELDKINNGDMTYLSNIRTINLLKQAKKISKELITSLDNDLPIDMLEIDIRNILDLLGEITGQKYDNELIDRLFSNFCLGK